MMDSYILYLLPAILILIGSIGLLISSIINFIQNSRDK